MASTGRFQSRVFSFLSQTTLRWRDRVQRTLRQAQLSATWGTQILLYPIYVIFQSVRLADRQLQQTARQSYPRLQAVKRTLQRLLHPTQASTPPKADTPVLQVLQHVRQLAFPVVLHPVAEAPPVPLPAARPGDAAGAIAPVSSPSALAESPLPAGTAIAIHGVASLRVNRALVLVTTTNHTLDVLNADQQAFLQQRIAWEVAHYRRQQKLLDAATQPHPPFLPPPQVRRQALPPVNALRRLMAWVQTSPVAIATDLFHESALVVYGQTRALVKLPQPRLDAALPPDASVSSDGALGWEDWVKDEWATKLEDIARRQFQRQTLGGAIAPVASAQVPPPASGGGAIAWYESIDPALAHAPVDPAEIPYIETDATVLGYERHPLERLLNWLDQGVAWLETKLAQFWNFLQGQR